MQLTAKTTKKVAILIACIILFVIFMALQIVISVDEGIKGIFSQIQVMISIFLVAKLRKQGFITQVFLNGFQAIQVTKYVVQEGQIIGIPGIVIPITTIITCTILLKIINNLDKTIVDSQKKSEQLEKNAEALNHIAYYDQLTMLPNRKSLLRDLHALCEDSIKKHACFALVILDLDNFSSLNDAMGHKTGDLLLCAISEKMNALKKPNDHLYRWGGDEFALIIDMHDENDDVFKTVQGYKEALQNVRLNKQYEIKISASFGVAFFPKNAQDSSLLIDYADTAMYKAKEKGRDNIYFFDEAIKVEVDRRFAIEQRMSSAIHNKELSLVFQPQYKIKTHELRGFEALLRWYPKSLGPVSPSEFIPMAEHTGLIIKWGSWVLENACQEFKTIMPFIPASVRLTVNISVNQLMHADFIDSFQQILRYTNIPENRIEVEITESLFIFDVWKAIDKLTQLKRTGVKIALDDFGVGYSSLYLLQTLPMDTLKIDKSLIQGLSSEANMEQIIESVIHLASQLGLDLVAEGVETEQQLRFLKKNNCDSLQGFLWGKPMAMSEIVKTLTK